MVSIIIVWCTCGFSYFRISFPESRLVDFQLQNVCKNYNSVTYFWGDITVKLAYSASPSKFRQSNSNNKMIFPQRETEYNRHCL